MSFSAQNLLHRLHTEKQRRRKTFRHSCSRRNQGDCSKKKFVQHFCIGPEGTRKNWNHGGAAEYDLEHSHRAEFLQEAEEREK